MAPTGDGGRRGRAAADVDDKAATKRSRPARRVSGQESDGRGTRPRPRGAHDAATAGSQGRRTERSADDAGDAREAKHTARGLLAARHAASRAAEQVSALTGRDPESVISIARKGDDWQIGLEVVEMHRIPESADILAVYHVDLDSHGDIVDYHRERRYVRSSTEGAR